MMALAEYASDMQDKFYEDDGDMGEPTGISVISRSEQKTRDEDGDESQKEIVMLEVGDATDEQVEQYVDIYYPTEHCQHAHDCCGNWYLQHRAIDRSGKFAKVTLTYIMNI